MYSLRHINAWSEKQPVFLMLFLRGALGLLLLFKGISFIVHTATLESLIAGSPFRESSHLLALYIGWAHLFDGVMIILGLLTRIAIIIQLPILIGAVFFINGIGGGLLKADASLWLSILVLLLLLFFLFAGGGPFSMDNYLKKKLL
jgi:uncharacterized membrane protein YphA (DoxX/SURF4 family)